ncbi:unnamed protein product [Effrenium voratum]|nr:unnamed protein product [Effrenium voratum]
MTEVDEEIFESSSLAWVNNLLRALWPNATVALMNFVNEDLTAKLQRDLPKPFKSTRFTRFSLGDGVPAFGPIEVSRHSDSHVLIEFEVRYSSAVDILLTAAGLALGVKRLDFSGRLCLELKPLLDTWPVVGAVVVYFATQPKIELQFTGLVDAPLPGIAKQVQAAVHGLLGRLVLPNFKCMQITGEGMATSLAIGTREPMGILKVQVCRGTHLAGANWKLGQVRSFTSNPYCILRLGTAAVRTCTVKGTTNPDWPETEAAYFVVYNKEQELQIDVMDDDSCSFLQRNFVGLLGSLRKSVSQLLEATPGRFALDTSQVKSGLLHVDDPVNTGVPSELDLKCKWLAFADLQAKRTDEWREEEPHGVVLVQLRQGTGFPEEAVGRKGLRWKCWLDEGAVVLSSGGKPPGHPDFQIPLPQCLYHVIDQLTARGVPSAEIAEIVEVQEVQVSQYLRAKSDFMESQAQRKLENSEVQCLELCWHETLALLVKTPAAQVQLSLLDGHDRTVGRLEPISVRHAMSGHLEKDITRKLSFEQSGNEAPSMGRLSAWMFPACTAPVLSRDRYQAVRMQVSVRYRAL